MEEQDLNQEEWLEVVPLEVEDQHREVEEDKWLVVEEQDHHQEVEEDNFKQVDIRMMWILATSILLMVTMVILQHRMFHKLDHTNIQVRPYPPDLPDHRVLFQVIEEVEECKQVDIHMMWILATSILLMVTMVILQGVRQLVEITDIH